MIIDITNINTTKLGFGKELRKEVADKVAEARKLEGNERLEVILRGEDTVIESGNKKALELLRDRINYAMNSNRGGTIRWQDYQTQ